MARIFNGNDDTVNIVVGSKLLQSLHLCVKACVQLPLSWDSFSVVIQALSKLHPGPCGAPCPMPRDVIQHVCAVGLQLTAHLEPSLADDRHAPLDNFDQVMQALSVLQGDVEACHVIEAKPRPASPIKRLSSSEAGSVELRGSERDVSPSIFACKLRVPCRDSRLIPAAERQRATRNGNGHGIPGESDSAARRSSILNGSGLADSESEPPQTSAAGPDFRRERSGVYGEKQCEPLQGEPAKGGVAARPHLRRVASASQTRAAATVAKAVSECLGNIVSEVLDRLELKPKHAGREAESGVMTERMPLHAGGGVLATTHSLIIEGRLSSDQSPRPKGKGCSMTSKGASECEAVETKARQVLVYQRKNRGVPVWRAFHKQERQGAARGEVAEAVSECLEQCVANALHSVSTHYNVVQERFSASTQPREASVAENCRRNFGTAGRQRQSLPGATPRLSLTAHCSTRDAGAETTAASLSFALEPVDCTSTTPLSLLRSSGKGKKELASFFRHSNSRWCAWGREPSVRERKCARQERLDGGNEATGKRVENTTPDLSLVVGKQEKPRKEPCGVLGHPDQAPRNEASITRWKRPEAPARTRDAKRDFFLGCGASDHPDSLWHPIEPHDVADTLEVASASASASASALEVCFGRTRHAQLSLALRDQNFLVDGKTILPVPDGKRKMTPSDAH